MDPADESTGAPLDWSAIDTVLLDMDGTLLDLRFDNWFWRELIPSRYALANDMTADTAWSLISHKFRSVQGTMQWYCLDHWSRELRLDIATLKREVHDQVGYLPGAEEFLRKLRASGKRCVLVTNSHPVTLAIKTARVGVTAYFDACYSTHPFRVPKEDAAFWPRLQAAEPFVAARTLFVDDSLPVLDSARRFGIGWLRAIRRPDSSLPPQATGAYVAVDRIADLL